jgi:hypothetical protein
MHEFYAESSFPLDRAWATRAFDRLLADPSRGATWLIERGGTTVGHVVLSVRFAMESVARSLHRRPFVLTAHRPADAQRQGSVEMRRG